MFSLIKKQNSLLRVISLVIIVSFFFTFTLSQTSFASRSGAGGGEIEEFGWGDFAKSVLFSIGGTIGMAALGSFTQISWLPKLGDLNYNSFMSGYASSVAASQVSGAINSAGAYYEWDRRLTYLASTVAAAVVASALNPSQSLDVQEPMGVSGMLKGAYVGGFAGLLEGGTVILIDGDAIEKGEKINVYAQILGQVAGTYGLGVARSMVTKAELKTIFGGLQIRQTTAGLITSSIGALAADKFSGGDEDKEQAIKSFAKALSGPIAQYYLVAPAALKEAENAVGNTAEGTSERKKANEKVERARMQTTTEALIGNVGKGIAGAAVSTAINYAVGRKIDKNDSVKYLASGMAANAASLAGTAIIMHDSTPEERSKAIKESLTNTINDALSFGLPEFTDDTGKKVSIDGHVKEGAWMNYISRVRNFASLNSRYGFAYALAHNVGDAYLSDATGNLERAMFGSTTIGGRQNEPPKQPTIFKTH